MGARDDGTQDMTRLGRAPRARGGTSLGATEAPLETVDAVGEAGSVECGAVVRIELTLGEGMITAARHQVYGCPATISCARELASRLVGISFLEAAALSEQEIAEAVSLAPENRNSASLALEALHDALGSAAAASNALRPMPSQSAIGGKSVLIGMSGGVDSAVAAMVLRNTGVRVVGLTLRLWSDPGAHDERSCCSPEAINRARHTAHSLGIPHLTVDASEAFYQEVVDYFIQGYGGGMTPNPCAKCNARLRFRLMLEIAERLGLSSIATGHYARLGGNPPGLMRGVDRTKDQSYVLAEVPPEMLRRVVFPLGAMTKNEVKALAFHAGLEAHRVPESQEICFVADDDHRRFLRERLGDRPGLIVDLEGRQIGRHSGTYNFTVGQRKGLGIAAPKPLYVVGVEAERALVMAGPQEKCRVGEVVLEHLVVHRPGFAGPVRLQFRSSGPAMAARLREVKEPATGPHSVGRVTVMLDEPASGVAPGQTAVLYDGDTVVISGTIRSTAAWSDVGENS